MVLSDSSYFNCSKSLLEKSMHLTVFYSKITYMMLNSLQFFTVFGKIIIDVFDFDPN